MASSPDRDHYAFTDPLGSSDASGARRRIRHALALIYGAAAPSLLLASVTDGGPLSQRLVTVVAMVATALMAVVLLSWRRPPDGFLLAGFPIASLTVTAIAVLDPPLALTPMFYVWPLMTAAYFLRRREALVTYGVTCGSFGAASLWAIAEGPRLMQWMTVVIVGAVVVGFVIFLKEGLMGVVTRLEGLAREDALTGALNRRALVERLDEEIARAGHQGGRYAVALLDIDHFKAINDSGGHAAGDEALRALVATVSPQLQDREALGRIGGDEFVVLLVDARAEAVEDHAEALRALVASAAGFSVSVGVASSFGGQADAEGLIAAADEALYRAKRAGRDTVRTAVMSHAALSAHSAAA